MNQLSWEKSYKSLSRIIEPQFKNIKSLGLYVTPQLIWRQTPKLKNSKINVFFLLSSTTKTQRNLSHQTTAPRTATEITQTGYSIKTSSDRSINHCVLWDAHNKLFCIFGKLYASGVQNADVTKSLRYALKVIILKSYKTIPIKTFPKQLQFKKI